MKIRYINMRNSNGEIETVDEFREDEGDYKSTSEFKSYVKRMLIEYCMIGNQFYLSQRCTNDWKSR